ncbi:VOC family protein [Paenibacillus sp. MWE-103]|uniref:VOC family protein n=1 Tax=Paenibacillus artemisiicola TaxID=1172618 RepID=A0ABS3W6J1_9BACL|nr:VOC family protein [Paenibacillus artemisiicola]MBO7743801.1 VOC family protein [Paenibacillus artemisiicola]
MAKQIGSSLSVLAVSDLARSRAYYRDVLGFDVTDWWAERDGLNGMALKLHQAPEGFKPVPNPPEPGADTGIDVQGYTDTWAGLDALYEEFKSKGASFAREPVVYPDFGPWKEFVVEDPDGYHLAFGGVDGGRAHCSIRPQIDSAILWVRDLDRAVDRYAKLMGLPVREEDRFGKLHLFRLDNGTHLMLDSHGMEGAPIPERGPSLKLAATDIERAKREALGHGFELAFDVRRLPTVAYFNLRDEDGNVVTVTQELVTS